MIFHNLCFGPLVRVPDGTKWDWPTKYRYTWVDLETSACRPLNSVNIIQDAANDPSRPK